MVSFSWLHLTDLHLGMEEHVALLPAIKDRFFDDVDSLHDKSGPWDFVAFTGDLTFRGRQIEFQQVDKFLNTLWEFLAQLGSNPVLLAVPGNHDLVRPQADPKKPPPAEVLVLNQWSEHSDVQTVFWNEPNSSYRNTVGTAFANYVDWWQKVPQKASTQSGLLPGDFSAVIEKSGASLGIVGLNSTFLQLSDGDYKGKLAIDARQFQAVCGGNGPQWVKKHNACLLLTHQPPDWLTPDSQQQLIAEIAGNNYFAAHLFGHMHEARYKSSSEGGAAPLRACQGSSLFGLEYEEQGKKLDRIHGYCAGRIELNGEKGFLTQWPRRAERPGGQWNFAADTVDFKLTDERTNAEEFVLLKPLTDQPKQPAGAGAPTVPRPFPQQWAVMVGVNNYPGAAKLLYCGQDVIDLAHAFRHSLGFQNVFEYLEGSALEPKRDSILLKLVEMRRQVSKKDLLVFYFSGHGINDGGSDYLLTAGCPPTEPKLGIDVKDLADYLAKIDCDNKAVFIDACRDVIPGKGTGAGTVSVGEESKGVLSDKGIIGFFSCVAKDRSFEIPDLEHGSFTYSLIKAIKDGAVETVAELDGYLRESVPRINTKYGKPPQQPFAVISPPERERLEIFFNPNWRLQAAQRFGPLVDNMAERFNNGDDVIEQLEFLGQARVKKQFSDLENRKLRLIESLCRAEGMSLELFFELWKKLKSPPAPPQMKRT